MSLCTYMFKPKHDIELAVKPIESFLHNFLMWEDGGVNWDIRPVENQQGWYKLHAYQEGESTEGFTEACWHEEEITPKQLTEDMMVLLVEAGICNEQKDEEVGTYYTLTDVELSQVISAVSQDDSYLYSPYEDSLYVYHIKTGHAVKYSMTDFILGHTIPEVEEQKKQLPLGIDDFSEVKESFVAP